MIDSARAILRLFLFASLTITCIPVQIFLLALRLPGRDAFPRWFHGRICQILGFRVIRHGQPAPQARLLVGNHVSWSDIFVLGSQFQGSFVSKAEVARWPVLGLLSRLQRTVYIDRRPSGTARHRDAVAHRLAEGGRLFLFPEGTSSPGRRVLPFKSALFAAVLGRDAVNDIMIQPVSLAMVRIDNLPPPRAFLSRYGWYGDMTLPDHVWSVLKTPRITFALLFHAPVPAAESSNRKELAQRCHRAVASGVHQLRHGRPDHAGKATGDALVSGHMSGIPASTLGTTEEAASAAAASA